MVNITLDEGTPSLSIHFSEPMAASSEDPSAYVIGALDTQNYDLGAPVWDDDQTLTFPLAPVLTPSLQPADTMGYTNPPGTLVTVSGRPQISWASKPVEF